MKTKLEYVWLDGTQPEPSLRSKIKIVDKSVNEINLESISEWGFDGSSTNQASGNFSDCYLKPVRIYGEILDQSILKKYPTVYVFCEVLDGDGNIHPSNQRAKLGTEDVDLWIGFEQEYFIRSGHNKPILGFNNGSMIDDQGIYYCGVGGQIVGRSVSEEHLHQCLNYGINVEGTNAEVALGQWEYQIFAKGKLNAADDLWMSRYFLYKICEQRGYQVELNPKPIRTGQWNGSGLHTNFSNKEMREEGGEKYFEAIFKAFASRATIHIENYGSDNEFRLTGKFETQSIDKFTWGFSDRGASIRVPKIVKTDWKGYLEDRRPASNADPYRILKVISDSLVAADELKVTLQYMYSNVNAENLEKKYGALSGDELLKEYKEESE